MRSQKILAIKKRYPKEWVLIKVDKMDEATTTPITGRLIAHAKMRDKIYKKMMKVKGRVLVMSTEDKIPKGYAIAFHKIPQ